MSSRMTALDNQRQESHYVLQGKVERLSQKGGVGERSSLREAILCTQVVRLSVCRFIDDAL